MIYQSSDGKFEIKNCGLMNVWSKTTAFVKCLPHISVKMNSGMVTKTIDIDLAKLFANSAKCYAFDYRNSKILLSNAPSSPCAESLSDLVVSPLQVVVVDLDQTFVMEKLVNSSETINLNSLGKYQEGDKILFTGDNSWIYFGMHWNSERPDEVRETRTFAFIKSQLTSKLVPDVFQRLDQTNKTFVPSFSIKGNEVVSEIDQNLGGGWQTPPRGKIDAQGLFLPE